MDTRISRIVTFCYNEQVFPASARYAAEATANIANIGCFLITVHLPFQWEVLLMLSGWSLQISIVTYRCQLQGDCMEKGKSTTYSIRVIFVGQLKSEKKKKKHPCNLDLSGNHHFIGSSPDPACGLLHSARLCGCHPEAISFNGWAGYPPGN